MAEVTAMETKLTLSCILLWAIGITGMFLTRGAGYGPGDLGFELFARAFGVGGLAYVFVGALSCIGCEDERGRRDEGSDER
ncbi:MAG TPA: hypothetical protein ENJ09_00865 [Planctomycetes bacterium]|nr:hypothetical protein [Planctomycetota bacterium]